MNLVNQCGPMARHQPTVSVHCRAVYNPDLDITPFVPHQISATWSFQTALRVLLLTELKVLNLLHIDEISSDSRQETKIIKVATRRMKKINIESICIYMLYIVIYYTIGSYLHNKVWEKYFNVFAMSKPEGIGWLPWSSRW